MISKDESSDPLSSRILPRYTYEARIRIGLRRNGQTRFVGGWARDLSESGVGAFVAEEIELHEEVTLELTLGNDTVTIPSKVLRVLGTQYGFQFVALSPDQRAAIRKVVAGQAPITFSHAPSKLDLK